MSENYRTSENTGELFTALVAAQRVMRGAVKDAKNPHFGNKYADLASVWEACREPLASNGLTIIQPVSADGPKVVVTTLLAHKSGQWIASDLTLTSTKPDPQGIGSAITYGRRYGLSAMVGIAPEDDDGNAASGKSQESGRKPVMVPTGTSVIGGAPLKVTLDTIKGLKQELGSKLFGETLAKHDVYASKDITTESQAQHLLSELGKVRMQVIAARDHSEAVNLDENLWNSLPDTHQAKILREMREKLAAAIGSQETALDEYERLREESATQWEFYRRLEKAHEFYCSQVGA